MVCGACLTGYQVAYKRKQALRESLNGPVSRLSYSESPY